MEFNIDLYDPITEYEEKEKREVSLKTLRTALKDRFDQSSALDGIKAQLRKQVLSKLLGKENLVTVETNAARSNLKTTVANSCIFSYLKQHGLHSTLSVFAAESGLEGERNILSELDICRMLKFNELSSLFQKMQKYRISSEDDPYNPHPIISELMNEQRTSLLDLILEYCLILRQEMTREISIQAGPSTFTARELLDHELFHLEQHYSDRNGKKCDLEGKGFEERMVAFQRELEERKNREVEIQVRFFRENEASKIRMEEASKARSAMEAMRQELEFDYNQRLKAHHEREQEAIRRTKEQERLSQANAYETRQQMEREMEEIRARENMLSRKVDLESQGLKLLEIRLKEAQLALEQRERDARKLELDANQKYNNAMELARKETNLRMQKEFEELNALRYDVNLEKRKIDEEKLTVQVDKESNRLLRDEMSKLRELLATREGESSMLKWSLSQVQAQLQQQLHHQQQQPQNSNVPFLYAMKQIVIDDDLDMPSTPNTNLLQQRPSESNMHAFSSPHDRVLATENQILKQELEQLRSNAEEVDKLSAINQSLSREIENLKTDLHYEKARALGREHKIEELQRLVQEKSQTIDSLSRQLDAQARREKQQQQQSSVSYNPPLVPSFTLSSLQQPQQQPLLASLLKSLLTDEAYERALLPQGVPPLRPAAAITANSLLPVSVLQQPPPSSAAVHSSISTSSPEMMLNSTDISPINPLASSYIPVSGMTNKMNPAIPYRSREQVTFYDPEEARRRAQAEEALRENEVEERRRRLAIEEELQRLKEQEVLRLKRAAMEAEEDRIRFQAVRALEDERLREQQVAATARRQAMERDLHGLSSSTSNTFPNNINNNSNNSPYFAPAPILAPAVSTTANLFEVDPEKQRPLLEQQRNNKEEEACELQRQKQRADDLEQRRQQRLREEAEEDARERQREEERRLAREQEREQERLRRERQEKEEEEERAREKLRRQQIQEQLVKEEERQEQERQMKENERLRQEMLAKEQEEIEELGKRNEQERLQLGAAKEQQAKASTEATLAAERQQQQENQLQLEKERQEREAKEKEENNRLQQEQVAIAAAEAEDVKRKQEEDEIAEARRRVLERRKQKAAAEGGVTASTDSLRGSWSNSNNNNTAISSNNSSSHNLTSQLAEVTANNTAAIVVKKPVSNRPVFDFAEESDSKIEFDVNSDDSNGGPEW